MRVARRMPLWRWWRTRLFPLTRVLISDEMLRTSILTLKGLRLTITRLVLSPSTLSMLPISVRRRRVERLTPLR